VNYDFPDAACHQVVIDFPVRARKCYRKVECWMKGDGSGNKLVVWLGAVELFADLNLRYTLVSEFTLPDLFDFNLVVVPYNHWMSDEAERKLKETHLSAHLAGRQDE